MKETRIRGIYAVTPDTADTAALIAKVTAALRGGVRLVQYRNKSASVKLQRKQCAELLACVRAFDGTLIVNDNPDLAADADADGVHLGKDDDAVAHARSFLGADKLIGVSCYNDFDRAQRAEAAGANYVAFGSFFPSSTKPGAVRADIGLLQRARATLRVPVVAIGGIGRGNASALLEAGADALAIVRALFAAKDIELEARAMAELIGHTSLQ
jgi:thiamine-phosphate pyrophosphorylase